MEMKAKKWFLSCMSVLAGSILIMLLVFWIFDPYFHYHKPFSFISYRLYDERYINDGISRHFDYDAIITGTSMAQNFKTSEVDALFGVESVKVQRTLRESRQGAQAQAGVKDSDLDDGRERDSAR